jgi:hypothetical protein
MIFLAQSMHNLTFGVRIFCLVGEWSSPSLNRHVSMIERICLADELLVRKRWKDFLMVWNESVVIRGFL